MGSVSANRLRQATIETRFVSAQFRDYALILLAT